MIIPTGADDPRMTTAKRQTLADFMYYSLCEGQTKAGPYGYSPLPVNLVQAGFDADRQAEAGRPEQSTSITSDVKNCNNPTFVPGEPDQNHLADIAPMPPDCDRPGRAPARTAPVSTTRTRTTTARCPAPTAAPVAAARRRAGGGTGTTDANGDGVPDTPGSPGRPA